MRLLPLMIVVGCAISLSACQSKPTEYGKIDGKTMGTTYHISFELPEMTEKLLENAQEDTDTTAIQTNKQQQIQQHIQQQIDKKLVAFNDSLSTWQDDSIITQFNQSAVSTKTYIDYDFMKVFQDSRQVYQQSGGAFDPSVKPILELWGFSKKMRVDRLQNKPTDAEITAAKALIDFNSVQLDKDNQGVFLQKSKEGVSLDFSAIAKGYAVDVIVDVLQSDYHINNYMVEIGGEVATSGVNATGQAWQIAIDAPILHSGVTDRKTIAIIRQPTDSTVNNNDEKIAKQTSKQSNQQQGSMHLATSGNYRNSLVFDNVRYSHTIDPNTGSPIVGGAASVTVAAETVALADAWATALTAMPYQKALDVATNKQLAVMFITAKDGVNISQDAPVLTIDDWQIVETDAMKTLRSGVSK